MEMFDGTGPNLVAFIVYDRPTEFGLNAVRTMALFEWAMERIIADNGDVAESIYRDGSLLVRDKNTQEIVGYANSCTMPDDLRNIFLAIANSSAAPNLVWTTDELPSDGNPDPQPKTWADFGLTAEHVGACGPHLHVACVSVGCNPRAHFDGVLAGEGLEVVPR